MQSILGPTAGLSDKEIKDALWYYYFDEEKTISYLLDQQHKKSAAKEKAEIGKRLCAFTEFLSFSASSRRATSRPSTRF